jgi:hypothetical protein
MPVRDDEETPHEEDQQSAADEEREAIHGDIAEEEERAPCESVRRRRDRAAHRRARVAAEIVRGTAMMVGEKRDRANEGEGKQE